MQKCKIHSGVVVVVASIVFLLSIAPAQSENFFLKGAPKLELDGKDASEAKAYPRFDMLAKLLSPSVVNISVESEEEEEKDEKPVLPFLKPMPRGDKSIRSLGSGFILSEDGYIATNYHVIEKADRIIVRLLDDKTEYVAELIGKDDKTDLALLKIKPKTELKPVFLGDSNILEVGEWVMAIGNQFQLGQTVTAGIVSAKSRRVPARMSGPYDNFIQTDASINPGSSGGPLFNTQGQVIGINTAIFSPGRAQFGGTGFNIGIGFAIPINMASDVLRQLKQRGRVIRGMLGVVIQNIDAKLAKALKQKEQAGALVADIVSGSPAAKAGFQVKDIIVSYNGKPVREHDDLPLMVANTKIGSRVSVKVIRDGETITLEPKITELKTDSFRKVVQDDAEPEVNELGIVAQEITEDIAKSLGIESTTGVIISAVEPNSPAAKAGLARGDVIEELDNRSVVSLESLELILKSIKKKVPILVLVRRKEGTRFMTVTIE